MDDWIGAGGDLCELCDAMVVCRMEFERFGCLKSWHPLEFCQILKQ